MGFQMAAVILLCVWGGSKLDTLLNSKPLFIVILSLFGVFAALYLSLKDFFRK
jgi:F0F1-type ATP synthase assembly protein I